MNEIIDERIEIAVEKERRRIIGIMLSEYGIYKLQGEERIAKALDALALKIEHPDAE